MAVVRKPSGEGWPVIEGVLRLALGLLELLLKGIDLLPILEDFLFLLREVRSLGDYQPRISIKSKTRPPRAAHYLPLANFDCM